MTEAAVCVFAKAPVAGRVKTRLGLPGERAVSLHRAFVSDTMRAVAAAGVSATLAVADADPGRPAFPEHTGPQTRQVDGDLGVRMTHALAAIDGPAIVVGTDAPTLPPRVIAAAARALRSHPVVFAPASDGGYVLVGARTTADFQGVRWSSEHTLADSLARNPGAALTEPWYDVDTPADLALLRAHLSLEPTAAPATAALLSQWRA